VGDRLSFTEPLMAFAHVDRGDGPVIRVAFDEEARPLWGPPHGPVVLEFDGSPDTLRAAADDLRQQLDRTPIRGEAPLPSDPAARPTTPGLIALLHGAMVVGGHVFDRWETVLRAILP
jgi:hypothetical protein